MTRTELINKYENMLYKFGEFDVWADDIEPKLSKMSTQEILKNYKEDKIYYKERESVGGWW